MLSLALFWAAAALSLSDADAIAVRLDLARDAQGRPSLTVHAEYSAGHANLTSVRVRTADGDGSDCDVRSLAARDLAGSELRVEPGGRGRWLVYHPVNARFRIEARIDPTTPQDFRRTAEFERTVFDERVLHTGADWVLPVPEDLDRGLVRPVRLQWTGCEPLGWEAASSFGGGMGPFDARMTLRELQACWFVAGEVELFDYEVHAGRLLVAAAGEGWGSDRIEFAELARDATTFARAYFDDTASPFQLVSLLPRSDSSSPALPPFGVSMHRANAIFAGPGAAFSGPDGRRSEFAQVLLHEAFHGWSADRWIFGSDTRPYWFIEGFAEFYARRLALRGGWIDLPGYVEDLNSVLTAYARNPEREALATRVAEQFWSDPTVRWQPYLQGDLIAARIDAAIGAHSAGERSLDDFLFELVREATATPGGQLRFARGELLERLESWCGNPLDDVRESVEQGRFFLLPADCFAPVLELETIQSRGRTVQRARLRTDLGGAGYARL